MNILDSIFIERIGPRDKAEVFVQYTETKKKSDFHYEEKIFEQNLQFFFL